MATFTKVGDRWRAQVRRKKAPAQAQTFDTKAAAAEWARSVENKIDQGIPVIAQSGPSLIVRKAIEAYRALREEGDRVIEPTSNEHYQLNSLERLLGDSAIVQLTPKAFTEWARERRREGAGGYTINMELSKLGTVFRYVGARLNVIVPDVVGPARVELLYHQLISGANKRDRRPAEVELIRLLTDLPVPHARAVGFGAMSTLRRSEVCRIEWKHLDPEAQGVWVYGRKHPRKRHGVDEFVPLGDLAWQIIQTQACIPGEPRIFPLYPNTLSKYVRKSCEKLGIVNLRLHDMRHEGTSLLFEEGNDIPLVALFTGHKSWVNLKRYTNLDPRDVRLTPEQRKARATKKRAAVKSVLIPRRLKLVKVRG